MPTQYCKQTTNHGNVQGPCSLLAILSWHQPYDSRTENQNGTRSFALLLGGGEIPTVKTVDVFGFCDFGISRHHPQSDLRQALFVELARSLVFLTLATRPFSGCRFFSGEPTRPKKGLANFPQGWLAAPFTLYTNQEFPNQGHIYIYIYVHESKGCTPSEHPKWVVHLPQNGTIGFDPQPYPLAETGPVSCDRGRSPRARLVRNG